MANFGRIVVSYAICCLNGYSPQTETVPQTLKPRRSFSQVAKVDDVIRVANKGDGGN